jgi:hypothetical protein
MENNSASVFHLPARQKPMLLRLCLLILLLGSCILLESASFSLISSYKTNATIIAVDNFSNFYAASDYKLFKFSPDGSFLYPYEEFSYGKIGMVDVTNPMKILVFYPDFLTVITLDKFLSPLTTYNFFTLGYQSISAVASSSDGRLWFFDNTDFTLKKIDETGTVYQQSQPLNVILGTVPNPNFMLEKDNTMYVNDPERGIMVFDIFGSYNKTIPIRGLSKFQVFQDQIIYLENNRLSSYNFTTLDVKSLAIPDTAGILMTAIQKDRMAVLKPDKIDFYRY